MGNAISEVCVLLGGGIDSAALVAFYQSRGARVKCMHFEYGQPSLDGERKAVRALTHHYGVPLEECELGISLVDQRGEYRGRNALLILAAASAAPGSSRLAIGIHAGVPYYDCSRRFIEDIQRILDGYSAGVIQVEAPFVHLSKLNIWEFCLANAVPTELTYSCERHGMVPCGECPSCRDREAIRASH